MGETEGSSPRPCLQPEFCVDPSVTLTFNPTLDLPPTRDPAAVSLSLPSSIYWVLIIC